LIASPSITETTLNQDRAAMPRGETRGDVLPRRSTVAHLRGDPKGCPKGTAVLSPFFSGEHFFEHVVGVERLTRHAESEDDPQGGIEPFLVGVLPSPLYGFFLDGRQIEEGWLSHG
jgi:hypothetical protein